MASPLLPRCCVVGDRSKNRQLRRRSVKLLVSWCLILLCWISVQPTTCAEIPVDDDDDNINNNNNDDDLYINIDNNDYDYDTTSTRTTEDDDTTTLPFSSTSTPPTNTMSSSSSSSSMTIPPPPFFVVCSVDGTIHVVNAMDGSPASQFPSGAPLVGPSELLHNEHRIVPGLDGRLYVSHSDDILHPLEITVMDVLQNPVKTCSTTTTSSSSSGSSSSDSDDDSDDSENEDEEETKNRQSNNNNNKKSCGIVTASKTTSLYALDTTSGELVWQQYANGTTVVASSSSASTVLLQREDVLVQQLSTDSGHAVWNVTLGTFQALDFGENNNHNHHNNGGGQEAGERYLPESSSNSMHNDNGRPILMEGVYDDEDRLPPQTAAPPPPLLPHVLFGPDGTGLTAIHPTEDVPLWNLQFPTVVASVFGLDGQSWKPLTVREDDEDDSVDDNTINGGGGGRQQPSITAGGGGGGVDSVTVFHGRQGVLEHLGGRDWTVHTVWEHVMYWFLDIEYDDDPAALAAVQQQQQLHYYQQNPLHQQWRVTSTNPESFVVIKPPRPKLALPSPTSASMHQPSHGLFLTWPVVVAILCSFILGAGLGFRYIYSRKKKRWLGLLQAAVTDKSVHFVDEKYSNTTMDDIMMNTTTTTTSTAEPNSTSTSLVPMMRRSHSLPGLVLPNEPAARISLLPKTSDHNNRRHRSNTIDNEFFPYPMKDDNGSDGKQQETTEPQQQQQQQLIQQQQHNVGFLIDGVPLIRYSRYESEFQEVVALGKGGFGTVFRCKNALDGREYAIKKVRIDTSADAKGFAQRLERTLREVKSLALLDHPNIVRYYTAWLEVVEQTSSNKKGNNASLEAGAATNDYYNNMTTTTNQLFGNHNNNNNNNHNNDATTTKGGRWPHEEESSYVAHQYSTSDLFLGHRRPSWDESHTKNNNNNNNSDNEEEEESCANPLGTYWDREDESLSRGGGFLQSGIPPALDDYGFTFDRSEDDDNNNNDDGEDFASDCDANDFSSPGYHRRNVRCGSSVSGDHSIHTLSESSGHNMFSSTRNTDEEAPSTTRNSSSSKACTSSTKKNNNKTNTNTTNNKSKKSSTTTTGNNKTIPKNVKHILYIQMQFCSQKTLADFLENKEARRGPSSMMVCSGEENAENNSVDIPFALDLFLQIVQGVQHVHSQGLIHRDLKPNNCFMDDTGMIKVGDFGLSRESGDNNNNNNNNTNAITTDENGETTTAVESSTPIVGGEITAGVGTRSYASPEQMKGSDYDSSTDVYSLGIILFELCYPMYTGMERNIVLSKLRDHGFPDLWLSKVQPAFPSLHTLLVSMLSNTPSERPTAETVARSISSILEGFTISSLDKHQQQEGSILLRVEAKPREDVLQHTIQLIKASCSDGACCQIVQYGLRGGTNKAIMEFAIAFEYITTTINDNTIDIDSSSSSTEKNENENDSGNNDNENEERPTPVALGDGIVSRMSLLEDIFLIRQVSATKYT